MELSKIEYLMKYQLNDISVGSEAIKSLDGFTTCTELVGEMDMLKRVEDGGAFIL